MTDQPNHGIELLIRTTQANRRELLQTLEEFHDRLAANAVQCHIFESLTDANIFLWTEWWPDTEGVDNAEASSRFRTLLGAIQVLGTLESNRHLEGSAGYQPNDTQKPQKFTG